MYTEHYNTTEYPFDGYFFYVGEDKSKPLDERVEEEIVLFRTKFDLSEGSNLSMDSFRIFFPFDFHAETLNINEGNTFSGIICGSTIKGMVLGIYPSQLGGCTILLKRM